MVDSECRLGWQLPRSLWLLLRTGSVQALISMWENRSPLKLASAGEGQGHGQGRDSRWARTDRGWFFAGEASTLPASTQRQAQEVAQPGSYL